MSKISQLLTTVFPVLLFSAVSCSRGSKEGEIAERTEIIPEDIVEMRDDQVKMAKIEMGSMELRSLGSSLKVSGTVTVAPQNLATVCAPLGGFVKNVSLLPGYAISKGQTLAVIENQEFVDIQQDYLGARNDLAFAQAEYERHSELYKNDVYSQQNVQEVTADYRSLKAKVKALEQKLALIGIDPAELDEDHISRTVALTSPISGYVRTVNVNLGKFVNSTDILFEIVNSDRLLLELTVFEKDADKIATGQKIRFFVNNESEPHDAIIAQTGKSISGDKTCKAYANVTSGCKNVLPGMYVNATVETSENKVMALPAEAVVSFGDKDYIFVFERNKEEAGKPFVEYRMVEVHKGISVDGYTEIILPEGLDLTTARIVIKGAYNLLSAKKNAGEMAC